MSNDVKTARSYRGTVVDDNAVVSINLKWLGQGLLLVASLVYGYVQIEGRIAELEVNMVEANQQIEDLLEKHIAEEKSQREELVEKVAWYEKSLNINPLSNWGKGKKK